MSNDTKVNHGKRRLSLAALVAFSAGTAALVAALILFILFGFGVITSGHSLPDTDLNLGDAAITTMPQQSIEKAPRPVKLYVRVSDWSTIQNIVANDVNRHGGWHRYDQRTGYHYYVPREYLETMQPLLDLHDVKPFDQRYVRWAEQALEQSRLPAPVGHPVADTHVNIQFSSPIADLPAQRRAIIALFCAGLFLYAVAVICIARSIWV